MQAIRKPKKLLALLMVLMMLISVMVPTVSVSAATVSRGDIKFTKVKESSFERLPNVAFKITNKTTGEYHIAVTDDNGEFSSENAWAAHNNKTNANDAAYNEDTGAIDDSKLDPTAGIWFSKDKNGDTTNVSNSLGALPYDVYVIDELECEANTGMKLLKGIEVTVYRTSVHDLGALTGQNISLDTSVVDKDTGLRKTFARETVTVEAVIDYTGVQTGEEYVMSCTVVDKETGEPIDDGEEISSTDYDFTPTSSSGSVEMDIEVYADELKGKEVVVIPTLYKKGIKVASDEALDDSDKTIRFVNSQIDTVALDDETESHMAYSDNKVSITDTVSYSDMIGGFEYELTSTLIDADTEEPIVINGSKITKTQKLYINQPKGSVDVNFEINATGFEGRTVVVYQELTWDDVVVAEHVDSEDENQRIHFPEITTSAFDEDTDDNISFADKDVTIIDTVSYKNVIPGSEFTLKGKLIDKDTGEIFTRGGKEVTSTVTFEAEHENGSEDVTFAFNGSDLEDKTLVVYEEMTYKGHLIAQHKELNDAEQKIQFPKIRTSANDSETGNHISLADGKVKVIDTITYSNLLKGKTYTVEGYLVDKDSGETLLNDDELIEGKATFTAKNEDGTAEVAFNFDASEFEGKTAVLYESLYFGGSIVAIHEDISDDNQAVHFPKIRTLLTDSKTKAHISLAENKVTVTDNVSYENLLPGEKYSVTGTLVDKNTGEAKTNDGKPITATTTFTAEKANGEQLVTFVFNAFDFRGDTVVAFEEVSFENHVVGTHKDIEDEKQAIQFPKVLTAALDGETDERIANADSNTTITDEVTYKNVIEGEEYTVVGTLMDKDTESPILVNGKEVTATKTFTSNDPNGRTNINFEFDASGLEGKTVVVFETLYYKGDIVGIHADINDANQSIHFPKVTTVAKDNKTGTHVAVANGTATFTDEVKYENVLAGKQYTLEGILVDRKTGEPIESEGEAVTATGTFTAEETSGTAKVQFEFDASDHEGKVAVVYETLKWNSLVVGTHKDTSDENQSVYLPKVRTVAVDSETKDHISLADDMATIIDTATYECLYPGLEYTIQGLLVDATSGAPILINDEPVIAEQIFTADSASGKVDIKFNIDASKLAGKTVSVYEAIYYKGILVGKHWDIDDVNQHISFPQVKTAAVDGETNEHMAYADESVKLTDTVTYNNVLPNKEYTVKSVLMDKATEKPVVVNGKEVSVSKTFTATKSSGTVDVEYDFDASDLAGKTVVVYETLYYKGVPVGEHHDINDTDQTIHFPKVSVEIVDSETQKHVSMPDDSVKLTAVIKYENVLPGKEYTLNSVLMDKDAKKEFSISGEEKQEVNTFVADKASGSQKVTFEFDGTGLEGKTLVIFEKLSWNSHTIAANENYADEAATVHFPTVDTSAVDSSSNGHIALADKNTTIIDTFKYSNLRTGETYKVTGTLMDAETGEPLKIGNQNVTATSSFEADKADGEVKVKFEIDSSGLAGKTVVVFEELSIDGNVVGLHKELTDKEQTVHFPKIKTMAVDAKTNDHISYAGNDLTIVDTVSYENLIAGETYELVGTLMNANTGKVFEVNDKEVTSITKFTAKEADGSVNVEISFDGRQYGGKTIVVYELLQWNGKTVGAHDDIKSVDQTVVIPSIVTKAVEKESGDKKATVKDKMTIVDTITYGNLISGKEYKISSTLIDKETGKSIPLLNAKAVNADGETIEEPANDYITECVFTPKESIGEIETELVFDSSKMANKEVVVYQTITLNDQIVALHADINDADQTVTLLPVTSSVQTGDNMAKVMLFSGLLILSLISMAYIVMRKKNRV